MNALKLVRYVGTILAIVAAFVPNIPYAVLVLALLGVANGFMGVSEERRLIYLVTAGVLSISANALDMVPTVGPYITAIFTNFSTILSAGVLAVFAMIVKDRLAD